MAVALGVMALLLTLFTGGVYYWALLLAIIDAVPIFQTTTSRVAIADIQSKNNYREGQQDSHQIDYNEYRQWLSTLHTVMLHDTIISQDECDYLMVLAERWLGVRQIF